MKKVFLALLVFAMVQSVCFAGVTEDVSKAIDNGRIISTHDNFSGNDFLFVRCENESGLFDAAGYWRTIMDFTGEVDPGKNQLYLGLQYHADQVYHLEDKVTAKLGTAIVDLPQQTASAYGNQAVQSRYTLTPEFFTALQHFQGDAVFRVYYRTLGGQYYRDIVVPAKKIQDIKLLFSLVYPELTAAK